MTSAAERTYPPVEWFYETEKFSDLASARGWLDGQLAEVFGSGFTIVDCGIQIVVAGGGYAFYSFYPYVKYRCSWTKEEDA